MPVNKKKAPYVGLGANFFLFRSMTNYRILPALLPDPEADTESLYTSTQKLKLRQIDLAEIMPFSIMAFHLNALAILRRVEVLSDETVGIGVSRLDEPAVIPVHAFRHMKFLL